MVQFPRCSCKKAKVDPMPRKRVKAPETKQSVHNRFLDSATADWQHVHNNKQANYLHTVTAQILLKYLPVEDLSPLALESLSSIMSEHVFGELVSYLSDQSNLLMLVIRILSDDYETIIRRAEIESSGKGDVEPSGKVEMELSAEKQISAAKEKVVFSLDLTEKSAADDDNDIKDAVTIDSDDNVHERMGIKGQSSTDTSDSADEYVYVSDDLLKYFNVAPNHDTGKTSADTGVSAASVSVPAMMMMSASTTVQSGDEAADSKPSTIPMASLSAAMTISSANSSAVDNQKPVLKRESSQDDQSVDSGVSLQLKTELCK